MKWSSRTTETICLWSAIDWISVTRDHLYFFLDTTQAFIVPRRAFESDERFQAFVAQARQWHDAATSKPLAEFNPQEADDRIEKE